MPDKPENKTATPRDAGAGPTGVAHTSADAPSARPLLDDAHAAKTDAPTVAPQANPQRTAAAKKPARPVRNRLREIRLEQMMSKAELARKAGLSVLTVTRIENGFGCRMDTKRKILKALGLKVADRRKVFEDD
ncbi:MAG: helix-turn-helix transcriptional regulator [Myxococcales bacterium]|nr:helix-turn-helix transcriptional regulator [Myxococcales bacterium]